mgnify:CR=1 FL=1
MGSLFSKPSTPGITMPPPAAHPVVLGSSQTTAVGDQAKRAAAAAEGMGLDNTIKTSPQGLQKPATATTTLLGG